MNALLVVDVQRDFCAGGALEVPRGDEVVAVINRLLPRFEIVVASKDWHPAGSRHFEKWPVHCVQGSPGAEFHPALDSGCIGHTFLKGTGPDDDGYSAFEPDADDAAAYLRARKVDTLYVTGLCTEYCVKVSALDALAAGFATVIVTDAIRPLEDEAGRQVLAELAAKGIREVTADEVPFL